MSTSSGKISSAAVLRIYLKYNRIFGTGFPEEDTVYCGRYVMHTFNSMNFTKKPLFSSEINIDVSSCLFTDQRIPETESIKLLCTLLMREMLNTQNKVEEPSTNLDQHKKMVGQHFDSYFANSQIVGNFSYKLEV